MKLRDRGKDYRQFPVPHHEVNACFPAVHLFTNRRDEKIWYYTSRLDLPVIPIFRFIVPGP